MASVSIGVCAFNEAKNIRRSLESISNQVVRRDRIDEIIVVSSGSTDGTDDIVRECAAKDPHIRLVRQEKREGKNSAVNAFMDAARGEILVLVNADNVLAPGCLDHLLEPLSDPKVGVVGGHPVPVNPKDTLIGFAVGTVWDLHHRLSMIHPKVGEIMAFRNEGIRLPTTLQSDEDILRMELEKKGFGTAYAPEAIVSNKGPENLQDFMKQRVRVDIGEKYLKRLFEYTVPTWDQSFLLPALSGFVRDNKGHLGRLLVAVFLEAAARVYASVYVIFDRGDRKMWEVVGSTKDLD
jgi:biofilm PGA synthesis N-glycosyltransferase PgaC